MPQNGGGFSNESHRVQTGGFCRGCGAGGGVIGGGGGGGQVIEQTGVLLQPGEYVVTVGAGGAETKDDSWLKGPNGGASSMVGGELSITALGGGGGAGWNGLTPGGGGDDVVAGGGGGCRTGVGGVGVASKGGHSSNGTGEGVGGGGGGAVGDGAGGRIALYLTEKGAAFDAFDGLISTYASLNINTKHPVSANCGTIYEQTADEDFGCGTIIVRNDPSSRVDKGTTTLPVEGTTAAALKKAKLVVGAATRLNLASDFTFKDLMIEADSAKLDLMEHQLIVKSPWHAYPQSAVLNAGEWIDGKKLGCANIKWGAPGLAIMVR